jgi:hypothetical protein
MRNIVFSSSTNPALDGHGYGLGSIFNLLSKFVVKNSIITSISKKSPFQYFSLYLRTNALDAYNPNDYNRKKFLVNLEST